MEKYVYNSTMVQIYAFIACNATCMYIIYNKRLNVLFS